MKHFLLFYKDKKMQHFTMVQFNQEGYLK